MTVTSTICIAKKEEHTVGMCTVTLAKEENYMLAPAVNDGYHYIRIDWAYYCKYDSYVTK